MKPLEELLEIAKSATPGPWNYEPERYSAMCVIGIKPIDDRWIAHCQPEFNGQQNGQFIATFNPQTVIDLITQLKDAQVEIKSLNTFNTQFTRADKRSWGGLYIQVEQLEQRLKDAQGEIDWRKDNYYKLDDVNCKLNERIVKLEQRLKDVQVEIKNLNTFNTQFTRADKRSWGDLFNETTQLKQGIEKLKKRISWFESGSIHTCHAECEKPLCVANREIDKLKLENAELKELRIMNLAGISTASFQNTRESTKERITKDNPYWTAAYDDVCRTVDREINLRESLDVAREALAKLERGSLLDHIATEALQNINTLAEGK